MKYSNIYKGIFLARPNRFIANVLIDGKQEVCHVKNTGRCRELLKENTVVYLEKSEKKERKTKYSLVAVEKGSRLINIDSQAPNIVFSEAIKGSKIILPGIDTISYIKAEKIYRNSRFDFYIEGDGNNALIEVKGVTLEERGVVKFPDAPTLRGEKHIRELIEAKKEGYLTYLVFIVQMNDVLYFTPNGITDRAFDSALREAYQNGVRLLAYECDITLDSMTINGKECEIRL